MKKSNARRGKKNSSGIYTVPSVNTVTRRMVNPLQVALNRTPLLPAFVKVPKMLYYEPILSQTIANTNAVTSYFFTANGLYDPNITGSGHQPMGFDQMMLLYEQYCVTHSSIEVRFYPSTPSDFGISLSPDAVTLTSSSGLVENGLITYSSCADFTSGVGIKFPSLTLDCDVKGYFGQRTDREMINKTEQTGTASANPSEQVYFAISSWYGISGNASSGTLKFECLLSYDAIFFEPRKNGSSALPPFESKDAPVVVSLSPASKTPLRCTLRKEKQ